MTWEEASRNILPGKYRHFKGKEYEVLFLARNSETEEPVVVYRALYGEQGVWVRPASMWLEMVERDGVAGRRFMREDGNEPAQAEGFADKKPTEFSV